MSYQPEFSTTFTQADGALAAPWVNSGWTGHGGALQVLSGRVRSNAAITTELPLSVIDTVYPAHQYVRFTLPTLSISAGVTIYAMAHLRIAAAPTQTYLRFYIGSVAGATSLNISSLVAGTETFFATATTPIVAGDVLTCEVEGDTARIRVNGVIRCSGVSGAVPAPGRIGVGIYYSAGAQADLEIDDLELGELNVARPVAVTSRPRPFAPGLAR